MYQTLASRKELYINGQWAAVSEFEDVLNPATEEVIGQAPLGDLNHLDAALNAARQAFDQGEWAQLSINERADVMARFCDAIAARKDEVKALITAEIGATAMLVNYLQFGGAVQFARDMIELARNFEPVENMPTEVIPGKRSSIGLGVKVRSPYGVIAAITAYNFPLYLNLAKCVPALLMGNSVVLKPSPDTPYSALLLGDIADEIGLPAGVLNIITGDVVVAEKLTTDKRVDLISFTGSDAVGSIIMSQASANLTPVVMELGGKSALIVREDADLRKACGFGLASFTANAGQGCALTTRHLVHNSIKEQYIEQLLAMAPGVTMGDPAADPKVAMGPLISAAQRQRVEQHVQRAIDDGANLLCGGKRPEALDKGYFFEPTLFDDVTNDMAIAQQEVFGPVGVVIGFDTDEEAIALANDTDYGLSGEIFSGDMGKAYQMAMQLRTGGVGINGAPNKLSGKVPFGGIKRSGMGREFGVEGLEEFTYLKTISFKA
jgi:acyl-CoA reductase-like NAD-dependent aldehyde dehydrogenase